MRFSVPFIHQEKTCSCWHAAARMIYGYKRQACINPLGERYDQPETNGACGIYGDEYIRLATATGMRALGNPDVSYGSSGIESMLMSYGPIWAAGDWFEQGGSHAIVVTGVESDGTLYINDPWESGPSHKTVDWFNRNLHHDRPISMMYLP